MQILQLGPYPPPEGGVSRNMLAIGDELRALGHNCTFIATTKAAGLEIDPDVLRPSSSIALLRLLATTKFDLLHLHLGGDVTRRVLGLAFACSVFGRGKSVLTLHSGGFAESETAKSVRPSAFAGFIFRRFSRIIVVNHRLSDVFRRFGIAKNRIAVIPPFALRKPDKRVKVPPELGGFYRRSSPLLLAVGGLEKDYDPLFQVAAMKDVLVKCPDAGLMIVGEGSMRAEVESAVAKSGYADHIHIAGNVKHDITLHLIKDADILLRTTLFDGDAISVREALFLGTPIIATDNGMRPDGVHLIEIGDSHDLTDKVTGIVKAGKDRGTVLGSDTSNIAAVIEIYRNLCNSE